MDAKQLAAPRRTRRQVDLTPRDSEGLRHQADELGVRLALMGWSGQPYAQATVGHTGDLAARRPRRDPDSQAHAVGRGPQRSLFTT